MATETMDRAVLDPAAEEAYGQLEQRIERVKNRQRMRFLGTGVGWALAVFVAAFLGFSLADILFKLNVSSRTFALASTLIAVCAVFYSLVIRPWLSLGGSVQVARTVERAFPQLEEQLSTALEYGKSSDLSLKTSSPSLVRALMQQVLERSGSVDFARTVRWKPVLVAGLAAFVLGALMAGYAIKERRLFATTLARFLQPTADIPAPTLTVITSVDPGNDPQKSEVPVETSVPVTVELDGRMPPTATLSVFVGEGTEGRWEDRVMDRGDDGKYRATLRRLLENTRYRVRAGDAESAEFAVQVYKLPEITEFVVRLEHPAYTGRGTETLAPSSGDVRALPGTTIQIDVKANTDLSASSVRFKSGRQKVNAAIMPNDRRMAQLSFNLEKDDEYQIEVVNTRSRSATGSLYAIKALPDKPPKVTIRRPEKDLMVHRAQTVNVEIAADDDWGVREIGISHSLGVDETKTLVRRLDPPQTRADGKLVWQLGNLGLKGGEVIAYYAYALDSDTVAGPKTAKSDIHFLTVYDEEEYQDAQNPEKNKMKGGTPPAVKQLDKLIDLQKKLLKDTFGQARQRDAVAKGQTLTEAEKAVAKKTLEAQQKLRTQIEELLKKIQAELEQAPAHPAPQPEPKEREQGKDQGLPLAEDDPPPPGPGPQPNAGLSETELEHLKKALEKMAIAEEELKRPNTPGAVRPETEALRHLSETRRLLLSEKNGDPRFKMAMDKQSKKRQQQERSQEEQDQQQAREELAEMPKMMEREKKLERELQELSDRKKKNPPPGTPQTPEQKQEQQEQRKLQSEKQDELEKLAKDAEERARKLNELAARNPDMQQAASKMEQTAADLKKAAEELKRNSDETAKEQAQQAQNNTADAQRSLRNALEKQIRREMANLQKDAQELAQRQQEVAQQARELNNQEQSQQQSGQQSGQQQQQSQQQQGQQQQGQQQGQQAALQQSGQQQGQQQQGQQQGQQQSGQQSAQQSGGQQQSGQKGEQQSAQQQGGSQQGGQPQSTASQQGDPRQQGQGQGQGRDTKKEQQKLAGDQRDIGEDLKDLAARAEGLSKRAGQEGLSGAQSLEQAAKQGSGDSAASKAAEKAQEALGKNNLEAAQREAAQAGKALEQMARNIQDAVQKTSAADMKQLAESLNTAKQLAKDQSDLNRDIAQRRDPSQLAERQAKIGDAAQALADASEKSEVLRQTNRQNAARTQLNTAREKARETTDALRGQDHASAKAPGEKAEEALSAAVNEMERAAGKTLEEKAKDVKQLAKAARENQEKAVDLTKDVPEPQGNKPFEPAAAQTRDEAAGKQHQAARDAKRLEHALEGLQELAKDANPAAAASAREASETVQEKELPAAMEKLARDIEKLGDPKAAANDAKGKERTPSPKESAQQGEEFAKAMKDIEKSLDSYIAEAVGNPLEQLRSMETAAREASEAAKKLAQNDPSKPGDQKPGEGKEPAKAESKQNNNSKDGKPSETAAKGENPTGKEPNPNAKNPQAKEGEEPGEQAVKELAKRLQRLNPKLERLEPNAAERVKMREALAQMKEQQEQRSKQATPNGAPAPGERNTGGPAFRRIGENLDEISASLVQRMEKILRARDVRPEADEDAPAEYRALVEKYTRALSEDIEEERK